MSKLIHWEAGLLLRPQHLQRMQKAWLDGLAEDRRRGWVWPYGVVEAKFLEKGLKTFDVQFETLRAVMPSGVVVDYPETAEIDQPLNIKDSFVDGEVRIFLAVPAWQKDRANTLKAGAKSAATDKLLYQTFEEQCSDENTGGNPVPLKFRRIRARLMTGAEDPRGYETIELIRVKRDGDQPQSPAVPDISFIAPTLVLNGCPQLRHLLWELLMEANSVRDSHALRIKNAGFTFNNMQVSHLEWVLRLQTLNRHLPVLASLHKATANGSGVTPYHLYLAWRSLLGDLASLRLGHVDFEEADYKHDDAWPVFQLLATKIRAFLIGSEGEKTMDVPFEPMGDLPRQYPTTKEKSTKDNKLTDEQINLPTTCYYLSINTAKVSNPEDKNPNRISEFVQNKKSFKLLSRAMVDSGQDIVPGVIIVKPGWIPPVLASGERDTHIFQLDISNTIKEHTRIWERIREDRRIAIVQIQNPPVDLSKATFTLRMTKP